MMFGEVSQNSIRRNDAFNVRMTLVYVFEEVVVADKEWYSTLSCLALEMRSVVLRTYTRSSIEYLGGDRAVRDTFGPLGLLYVSLTHPQSLGPRFNLFYDNLHR